MYHTFCTSSTPPLLLHLSPSIFIASFNEISCLIEFTLFQFTLALASYNFFLKFRKSDCFKCKRWQAVHLKCVCGSWLLQIQNQQAALWNYLARCTWISAIATFPPTRFGINHWHAVSTCKWLLKPHLHGRLLAARIDILPFFFLKSRRSLTRRKIQVWFCLRDIARHAHRKIKS